MKRKYPKWKLAFEILRRPFVFIFNTFNLLRIRNQKRIAIREKFFFNDHNGIKETKEEIEYLSYIISQSLGIIYFTLRFILWPGVLYLMIYLWLTFTGRVSETEINADLYVSAIVLDSIDSISNISISTFNAPDSIIVSNTVSKESELSNKFVDTLNSQNFQEGIGFRMPPNAFVSIRCPDTNKTMIKISPHKEIIFSYNIYTNYSATDNKIGTVDKTEELIITLFGTSEYNLNPIITNQLYFNEPDRSDYYILKGTVHLLDTKGDSINLYQENYFSIQPTGKVKLYLSKTKDGFRVRFTTKVCKLDIGSEYGVDNRDSMPLKMQTNYDQYPYLWLTIPVLLPFLFNLMRLKRDQ